jgi:hypothetical protein
MCHASFLSSLPSWFGLAANSHCWHCVEKLTVFGHVAIRAKRYEIPERVIPLRAPLDPVVHLEIFQRAALLTSPPVSLQHSPH